MPPGDRDGVVSAATTAALTVRNGLMTAGASAAASVARSLRSKTVSGPISDRDSEDEKYAGASHPPQRGRTREVRAEKRTPNKKWGNSGRCSSDTEGDGSSPEPASPPRVRGGGIFSAKAPQGNDDEEDEEEEDDDDYTSTTAATGLIENAFRVMFASCTMGDDPHGRAPETVRVESSRGGGGRSRSQSQSQSRRKKQRGKHERDYWSDAEGSWSRSEGGAPPRRVLHNQQVGSRTKSGSRTRTRTRTASNGGSHHHRPPPSPARKLCDDLVPRVEQAESPYRIREVHGESKNYGGGRQTTAMPAAITTS